ncbi:hypothetical protein [Tolypothrix sp. VBCCA 56010]|uniref:hypothetical protein n=1 Tax=Tolypothrix sp. VBCCA 56010 TaxID=3137731 RepID=UPI003D7D566D
MPKTLNFSISSFLTKNKSFWEYTVSISGVDSEGIGNAGDINIQARSLSLSDGARIGFVTNGQGDAGSVTIRALDAVSLSGRNSSIFSAVKDSGIGNGGDINIQARSLSLSDNAQVATSTLGTGNAGNIQINTLDNISINNGSLVRADTFGTGNAGNIAIQAGGAVSFDGIGSFGVTSGVFTLVGTGLEFAGTGKGGDININARSLSLLNGAQLNASTFGQGDAGSIFVKAKDSVSVVGVSPVNGDASRLTAAVNPGAIGKAGDLTIETGQLIVKDRAEVTVNSQGIGDAGELKITAGTIRLDNQGKLIAETASGNGGNILLRANDLLLLRGGSQISTTAGTAQAGGNGGNITINTPFIIAVPNEDSDILANAFSGRGGRVNITANGVYGIQFRSQPTLQSDITASSRFGVAGVVEINTPDIDPSRGLIALPAVVVNSPGLIASNCNAFIGKKGSEFTITGRGGLPLSPDDFLSSDVVWSDTRLAAITTQRQDFKTATGKFVPRSSVAIVPATGWIFNNKGEVTLISHAPNTAPQDFGAATCAGNLSSSN